MIAKTIITAGGRGRWTVVGDGEQGPFFTEDDLKNDSPASFSINERGQLEVRALGSYHATKDMSAHSTALPEWAPKRIA